ncbi:unnamed protein product [Adineta steineri]|uniref:Uncharacterized protein n=1 Tax=Adineta steineri TaxID=433720 RepID=A0A818YLF1_9BILA|nr:unnamed protein product [Adineta steineri]
MQATSTTTDTGEQLVELNEVVSNCNETNVPSVIIRWTVITIISFNTTSDSNITSTKIEYLRISTIGTVSEHYRLYVEFGHLSKKTQ